MVMNRLRAVMTRNDRGGWWRDDGGMDGDRQGTWQRRQTVMNRLGVVMGRDNGGGQWQERHAVMQVDDSETVSTRGRKQYKEITYRY